jgi:UDP-glucose 4-epimerase
VSSTAEIPLPRVASLEGARCVLVGGAGFIGSSLARVLLLAEADVLVYDNLATGAVANLEGCARETGREPAFQHGDVRDTEKLARTLPGARFVFNLACLGVRHSLHSPRENHEVNAAGALALLTEARRAGVERLVHVSSSEVYGTARTAPMTEDHPTDPHTVYGGSKLAGECYARAFHRCYGFDTVVLRPFNAYGPRSHHEGDSGEVLPRFVVRALAGRSLIVFGDGTQTRDLTHVYDTAAAIARAAVAPGVAGQTLNVGSGEEHSINDLAELVRRTVGREDVRIEHVDPRPGDVLRLVADSSRAARVLGHRSTVGLEAGVRDLVERTRRLGVERLAALASAVRARNWE